jgi:competence protein ComEC
MLTALLCAYLLAAPADSAVLLIRVLDVSDARIGGDAILITDSAQGRAKHVLIDASDHGATVVTLLRRFHVDTLAALMLSHPHADHYGGMDDVLTAVPVRSFVYGGTYHTATTYRALLNRIAARHIPVVTVDTGVRRITLVTGRDTVLFTVLSPAPACRVLAGNAHGQDVNNCSIGVRLTRGAFAMLLPGDAEQSELASWLMTEPALLRADVLKAGHHGSSNGTSATLLDVVRPRLVLISANGRQHPFAEVLDMLRARGIPTYCTADAGTITVRVPRGGQWTVARERSKACHARTELTTGGPP